MTAGQPRMRTASPIRESAAPRILATPDLLGFHELRFWAESFEDAQRARISCANRMERGGVPPDLFVAQLDALNAAEHQIKLGLVRSYRRVVPTDIQAWAKSQFGIGKTSPHMLARLLGSLGHPRVATPYHWEGDGKARVLIPDPPFERTVRQLWSYCGHGDPERKKRKGMTADEAFTLGSPRCKMLVHLLAVATMKCRVEPEALSGAKDDPADPTSVAEPNGGSADAPRRDAAPPCSADQPIGESSAALPAADRRYRAVYDQARAAYMEREDWSDGHRHNAALRLVGKRILVDLWRAAA